MSNAEFIFFSYLANCLGLTLLVIRSINKKSPRALMRFLFMPILLTFLIGLALQEYMETSIFSNRQLLVSILLFAWCLKSIVSYNSIKIILLSNVLDCVNSAALSSVDEDARCSFWWNRWSIASIDRFLNNFHV